MGGEATPPEENADLLGFTPERAHLLFQGVYGDFPHHNHGRIWTGESQTMLHVSVAGARLLRNQLAGTPRPLERWGDASWKSWRLNGGGVLNSSWDSDIPHVFAHVVLTKALGIRRARQIWSRITRCMDLWERGQHAGMVRDAKVEGAA